MKNIIFNKKNFIMKKLQLILENKNIKNIDLQAFSKGIYFVQVIDEMGNNWIERIVKQ